MINNKKYDFEQLPEWIHFIEEYQLTEQQQQQFACYLVLLRECNQNFNLTTITSISDIIAYHFQDSLIVSKYMDMNTISMIADVGSGAGFPGIPLKIAFPHLQVILLEVIQKKVEFLTMIAQTLHLQNVHVMQQDWRTFLRHANDPIDLFVSRAALHTDELVRMFKPSCSYNTKQLIYWASKDWQMGPQEKSVFQKEVTYVINDKKRRLIFFSRLS